MNSEETNRQILADITEIKVSMARLEAGLANAQHAEKRIETLEGRISDVEQAKSKIFGWAIGVGAGAGAVVSLIAWLPTIARLAAS